MQDAPRVQNIKNPRRLLILGAPDSGVLPLLKDLTGTAPDPRTVPEAQTQAEPSRDSARANESSNESATPLHTTVAGLTHVFPLATKYYTTTVPIWLDETTDPEAWAADFRGPDAAEVVRAVGAWMIVFRDSTDGPGRDGAQALMQAVRTAIETAHGGAGVWDGVCLAVGMPPAPEATSAARKRDVLALDAGDEWEDTCWDLGFEFVDGSVTGKEAELRNAVGERRGVARVREALEACEWDAVDDELDALRLGDDDDGATRLQAMESEETAGFGLERAEMERDFAGLKLALAGVDEDPGAEGEVEQVEEMERMMLRLQAVKDMSAGMPEQERKRLAAKAVSDVMKEL